MYKHRWIGCAVVLACLSSQVWTASFDEAMALYGSGQFEKARAAFLAYLADMPDAPDRQESELFALRCLDQVKACDAFTSEVRSLRAKSPNHPVFAELVPVCECASDKETSSPADALTSTPAVLARSECDLCLQRYYAGDLPGFLERSEPFVGRNAGYWGTPKIMFLQMHALRKVMKYPESRAKARKLLKDYPQSAYAKMMGGIDGRTEDKAAFEFSALLKAYQHRDFKDCIRRCEEYLQYYPANWRKPDVYYYLCASSFHDGDQDKFEAYSGYLLNSSGEIPEKDTLLYLQILFAARQQQFDLAKWRIAEFRKLFPNSKYTRHVLQAELEAHLKYGNLQKLDEASAKYVPELLDRCLRDFAAYDTNWYGAALEMGHDFYTYFEMVEEWEPLLREQLAMWRTTQPKVLGAIYYELIRHAEEQGNPEKVLEIGKDALKSVPAGHPFEERIRNTLAGVLERKDQIEAAVSVRRGGTY